VFPIPSPKVATLCSSFLLMVRFRAHGPAVPPLTTRFLVTCGRYCNWGGVTYFTEPSFDPFLFLRSGSFLLLFFLLPSLAVLVLFLTAGRSTISIAYPTTNRDLFSPWLFFQGSRLCLFYVWICGHLSSLSFFFATSLSLPHQPSSRGPRRGPALSSVSSVPSRA